MQWPKCFECNNKEDNRPNNVNSVNTYFLDVSLKLPEKIQTDKTFEVLLHFQCYNNTQTYEGSLISTGQR